MSIVTALQEFSYGVKIIKPVMNESVPREERRKALCGMIDGLSDDTFKRGVIINRIFKMNMIDMSEVISCQYDKAEAQVEGILGWLPRMRQHKDKLTKEVEKHRKQYKLNG